MHRSARSRLAGRLAGLVLIALLGLPGCEDAARRLGQPAPAEPTSAPAAGPNGAADGWHRVDLRLLEGSAGGVLAFASVHIGDQGPFSFALDTGASHSVVDRRVAERLGLPETGMAGQVTGITGAGGARLVRVDQWRVGDVALPGTVLVRIDLPDPQRVEAFHGLLGSDMLSRFGAFTVDYDRRLLLLRPRG